MTCHGCTSLAHRGEKEGKGKGKKNPTETEYVFDVWARLNKVVGRNPYTEIWPDRNNKVHGP